MATLARSDNEKTSWQNLSYLRLVPDTARKCFLALKITFKDHLQPVVPKINSYHMETIFFNTPEKVPMGFWKESNMEECFRTLLSVLRDSLLFINCPHQWFSYITSFKTGVVIAGTPPSLKTLFEKEFKRYYAYAYITCLMGFSVCSRHSFLSVS